MGSKINEKSIHIENSPSSFFSARRNPALRRPAMNECFRRRQNGFPGLSAYTGDFSMLGINSNINSLVAQQN
ncbi:hypothetical protein, partial [Paraburkholderia phenazinium]|uniref:hypothetical protein n=1 Tax=Paraburkholderia phenazinium TaxID=60549 RepID=UPI001ABC5FE5